MQIELPTELVQRLQTRAQSLPGVSEADVLRSALDALDWLDEDQPNRDQLEATLRELDQSMAEVAQCKTIELREAKAELQAKLGIVPSR